MSDNTTLGATPTRFVLEGVPRVGKYPRQSTGSPEDHSFPSCLRGYLEYMKDDLYEEELAKFSTDWHGVHEFLMGTSGAAFGNVWGPSTWECNSWDITSVKPDALESIRSAFESVGYSYELLLRGETARSLDLEEQGCDDEATYRRRIIESIRRGRPVITRGGLCGPQDSALITGYDEDGTVLIGWHFYDKADADCASMEPDPSGYDRKRGWFTDLKGIILVGEKQKRRPLYDIYRSALERGLAMLRTRDVRGRAGGPSAYDAWIAALMRDEDFIGASDAIVENYSGTSGAHAAGNVAEARAWGAPFLRPLCASAAPGAKAELEAAADCFDMIHNLVWAVWEFEGQTREEHIRRLRRHDIRGRMITLIRLMKEKDEQAADHIERALAQWEN